MFQIKNIKSASRKIWISGLFIFSIALIFYVLRFASVTQAEDCSLLEGDDKKKCEELEKKAKVYEDIIKLKNKQQETLGEQLQSIEAEQEKNRQDLQSVQKQVDELDSRIAVLEAGIKEKEETIERQKKILTGLMQSYYEFDQQGILDMVILNQDLSDILNQSDYIQQSGFKVNEILETIRKAKNDLMNEKSELGEKRDKVNKLREELLYKRYNLESNEDQKQSLLIQTQGEEEKYKDLLARVEEQKQELFNFNEAGNIAEIQASVSKYPKPSDNLASTSWYFSQRDSRWGDQRIGNSKTLMKDYGCAVTAVSMVFKKMGAGIDPGKMAKQKIFYYDLIKWPGSWDPKIKLVSSTGHGNISWSKVDSEIKKGNPAIVYIKKSNGRGGHYVVVTGKDKKDYIVHDPYFGPNLYLGTSKALVGKIGADSKVAIDQMIIYN